MTYNLYISHSAWVVFLKGKIALPRQIFSKQAFALQSAFVNGLILI